MASSLADADYERLFDAHNTFEEGRKPASYSRLPLGDDGYNAPKPYDRETPELDFAG